jgi:hypothetical protein
VYTTTLLFNVVLHLLAKVIKQEKEIRRTQIEEEEVKLSILVDNMNLYLKDSKNSTKNIHE